MKLEGLPEALRRLAREKPRELAEAQADKIQNVDRVLRDGRGSMLDRREDGSILRAARRALTHRGGPAGWCPFPGPGARRGPYFRWAA